jgi:hypothetical protein
MSEVGSGSGRGMVVMDLGDEAVFVGDKVVV